MDLEYICKKIEENLDYNGLPSPFATAFVGSRVTGYFNEKSDYDFNIIFEKGPNTGYLNFKLQDIPISAKLQSRRKFEKNLGISGYNSEKSRFVYLPYKAIKNKNYILNEERNSRKLVINELICDLPKDKKVMTNIERLVEYPLIKYALLSSDYGCRLRRIKDSECDFIEKMGPKYRKTLKDIGYFVSERGEVVFENKEENKKINRTNRLFLSFKEKYALAKSLELKKKGYLYGGLWAILQAPSVFYNFFEKFPEIKLIGGEYHHTGPTLNEFLEKRRNLIVLEKASKFLKYKIIEDIYSNKPKEKSLKFN